MTIEKGLLIHWWHYYGKSIYTLEELDKFEKVIDEYGRERTFDVVIASYIHGDSSPTIMLESIRRNSVKKLFEVTPEFSKMEGEMKIKYEFLRDELLKAISSSMK